MTYLVGKHPYIKIEVQLQRSIWKKFECLIDTGFGGGLSLPQEFKKYFDSRNFVETSLQLADGSEITAEATYAKIKFKMRQKEIDIIFMGNSETLVGVEFLDKMKFCLDLKKNKVTLT